MRSSRLSAWTGAAHERRPLFGTLRRASRTSPIANHQPAVINVLVDYIEALPQPFSGSIEERIQRVD
ncbi:hypothetical protein V8Z77_07535 [Stutzerimonas stutzeri]|uniref:hypothetical protein n=1 Tax=Stutzerimonas stutzeri TaxID=316 RepID=UPI000C9AD9C0|nr:hypothetical protein [Stutzerimonas stutzeri]PNG14525.1 hypothetical protein CXK97_09745 [Stutzerimonas stutzeri]